MIFTHRILIKSGRDQCEFAIHEVADIVEETLRVNHEHRIVSLESHCKIHECLAKMINAFDRIPEHATVTITDKIKGPILQDYKLKEFMDTSLNMTMVLIDSNSPKLINMVDQCDRLQFGNSSRMLLYVTYKDFMSRFRDIAENYIVFGCGFNYIHHYGAKRYEPNNWAYGRVTLHQMLSYEWSKSIPEAPIDLNTTGMIIYREMPFKRPYQSMQNDIIKFQPNTAPVLYREVLNVNSDASPKTIIIRKSNICMLDGKVNEAHFINRNKFTQTHNAEDMPVPMTKFIHNDQDEARYFYMSNFFKIDKDYQWVLEHDEHHVPHEDLEVDYILRFVVNKTA